MLKDCVIKSLRVGPRRALTNQRGDVPAVWTNEEPLRCAEQSSGKSRERASRDGGSGSLEEWGELGKITRDDYFTTTAMDTREWVFMHISNHHTSHIYFSEKSTDRLAYAVMSIK